MAAITVERFAGGFQILPADAPDFRQRRALQGARRRLQAEQAGRCCYCLAPLSATTRGHNRNPSAPTVDHILPRSRGGTDEPGNLVLACQACNRRKGDLTPAEYLLAMQFGLA